jgi:RHS repeat-associated protein
VNYPASYAYDRQGNQVLITNPDNSQVKYLYNSAGLLEQVQRKESADAGFSNAVQNFDYSPLEKIISQVNANGAITTNAYDATKLYRLSSKVTVLSGGARVQDLAYTYDANGNITKIVDNSATNSKKTTDYTYDSLNRLLSAAATGAINGQNYTETYTYDAIGNITSKNGIAYVYSQSGYTNPHAVTSIGSTNYTYDDNGNLLTDGNLTNIWDYNNRLIQTSISSGQAGAPVTATFSPATGDGSIYKTNSSWTTAHDATSGTSASYTGTTSYVRSGKSGSTTFRIDRAFLPFNTSSLPDNAAITSAKLKIFVASKLNNDNDGDDWVTVAQGTEASTASLIAADYDNAGNATNPIEGIDSTERKDITNVVTGQYLTFNLNNTGKNWISRIDSTKLALREGHDAINSAFVGSYGQYNSLNIRTGEYSGTSYDPVLEVTYTLPPPTVNIGYAYDASGQRIKYSNGTDTTYYPTKDYNITGAIPTKQIFANDQLVATVKDTGAAVQIYFVHTDHLTGSNVVTNSSGTIEELMDYYPYGGIRLDEKSGSFSEQRKYAGHELDVDTGLSYMNARYYNGKVGRFVSLDPAYLLIGDQRFKDKYQRTLEMHLSDPQSLNSYSYVNNNPLKWTDLDGEILPLLALVAWGAVEIGLSAYDAYDTAKTVTNSNASWGEKAGSVGLFVAGLALPGGGYEAGVKQIGKSVGNAIGKLSKFEREVLSHGYNKHAVRQAEWGTPSISQTEYVEKIRDVQKNFDIKGRVQGTLSNGNPIDKQYIGNTKTNELLIKNTNGTPTFFRPEKGVINYIRDNLAKDFKRYGRRGQ